MRTRRKTTSLISLALLFVLIHSFASAQEKAESKVQPRDLDPRTEKLLSIPRLTGEELLCEIETDTYSGIFAVDTKKANPLPFPLVSGGRSPQWGPKHKVFSFIRAGVVWVGDCEGHIQPAGLIPRKAQNFQMFWDPSGRAFALYNVFGWTKVFARSINFHEDFVVQFLKERKRINLKFSEEIIMKADASQKDRFFEVQEGTPPIVTRLPVAPRVRPTEAVAFSPDASRFVMQVGNDAFHSSVPDSHLWLFKTIRSNINDPGYSKEKIEKIIENNDYTRFYEDGGVIPMATFIKELTGQNKNVSESHPAWSPDGTMLAYSQVNTTREEVWPHVLMGQNLEQDITVTIPNYLPVAKRRSAAKSVEVLFWGPEGDLYLIEGTRDKIYRAKRTGNAFVASVFVEVNASGTPTLLHPVLRGDSMAYTMSLDDTMVIHLKNTRTGEERVLPLAVSGSGIGVIQSLTW